MTKEIKKIKGKKKTRVFWSGEKILSISAILVSMGTFLVFAYQTNLMRKQQYMSVYPHLQFSDHHVFSNKYMYVLANKGIGPAIVTSAKISINGKDFDKDLAKYIGENIDFSRDSIDYVTSSVYSGLLITEKETVEIMKYVWGPDPRSPEKLFNLIHNDSLDFTIEYKSIYDEKWRISMKNDTPVKIE